MTTPVQPGKSAPTVLRSIGAVLAGLVANVVLALGADELMRALGVFPPGDQLMEGDGLFAIAFGYRGLFAILGGYLAARLAPDAPVRHALILGALGVVLAGLGVAAAVMMDIRPLWYPIALFAAALPLSWLGGVLHARAANGAG